MINITSTVILFAGRVPTKTIKWVYHSTHGTLISISHQNDVIKPIFQNIHLCKYFDDQAADVLLSPKAVSACCCPETLASTSYAEETDREEKCQLGRRCNVWEYGPQCQVLVIFVNGQISYKILSVKLIQVGSIRSQLASLSWIMWDFRLMIWPETMVGHYLWYLMYIATKWQLLLASCLPHHKQPH